MPLDPELVAQLQRRKQALERHAVAPSLQGSSAAQGTRPTSIPALKIPPSSTGRRVPEIRRNVGEFCHVTGRVEETPASAELKVKLQRQKRLSERDASSANVLDSSAALSARSASSPTRKTSPLSPAMCVPTDRRAVAGRSSAVDSIERSPADENCSPETTTTPTLAELSGDQSTTPGSSCWSSASHDEASEKGFGAPIIDCAPPPSWQGACSQQPTAAGMMEEQEEASVAEEKLLGNELEQQAPIRQSAQPTEQEPHRPQSLCEADAIQERIANLKVASMRQRCVNQLQAIGQQQNASTVFSPIAFQTQNHTNALSLAATARRAGRLCAAQLQPFMPAAAESRSLSRARRLPSRQLSPVHEHHAMPFEPMPRRAGSRRATPSPRRKPERGMSRASSPAQPERGSSRANSPRATSPTERGMSRASGPRGVSPTQQGISRSSSPRATSPTERGMSRASSPRSNSPSGTCKAPSSAAAVIRAFSPNLGSSGAEEQMDWLCRDFQRHSKHWKEQIKECKEKADYYEALLREAERKKQVARHRQGMHPESPQSQTRAIRPMYQGSQMQDRYEASKKSSGNPINHSPRVCRTSDLALSERKR